MAVTIGPKLKLPINAATGDVWDSPLRTLLRALDQLSFLSVITRGAGVPPSAPANGDAHIVGASAIGDWAGSDQFIAVWTTNNPTQPSGLWEFYAPNNGWLAWSVADNGFYVFQGGAWAPFTAVGAISVAVINVTLPHPSDPDFELPHGLSGTPRIVIPVSQGGLLYLQSPKADATNVKISSSAPEVIGTVFAIL